MGIRFESNYQRLAGIEPITLIDLDPLVKWIRIHEWRVDPGFTGRLLMVMLNAEPMSPTPTSQEYGWMRLSASLATDSISWVTSWEGRFFGATLSAKQYTPRLTILPMGSGMTLTAGQGIMTTAFPSNNQAYGQRWWSCYVIDAEAT